MQDIPGRGVAAVCVWTVLLMGLLPGLIVPWQSAHASPAIALQCVVVAHTGGALTRVLTATRARLVALGFWIFAYIWFGLTPLVMLATDSYPWAYRTGEGTSLAAVAVIELGLLAHSAGAAFSARAERARTARVPLAPPGPMERLLSRRIAPWRLLVLGGLAIASVVLLVPNEPGGVGAYFTSREAIANMNDVDDSALQALRKWFLAVPAFWALLGLLHVPRVPGGDRLLRCVRWLLLPLLIAVNVVVNNPISEPRFWAFTVLLTLLFATTKACRPRAFRAIAATLTVTILLIFPYADYFRTTDREHLAVVSIAEQFTSNGDYDAFQQVQTGIDYARNVGFTPKAALDLPLLIVPRSIWPDKPVDTGITLGRYANYDFLNISAPLWIESYLWAGPPAVAIVFFLYGVAGQRMDDVRHRQRGRRGTLASLLVPAFAFYQMVFLRGSVLGIGGPLLMLMTVPLLITTPGARASRFRASAMSTAPIRHVSTT
ncbi:hypothetical protein AB0N17_45045, partial [Streptomyces sp. NPDC051133]|uniref:hypothetical protein n=1 Tax=Streptomyces sp. NPDC051133 TaxID=3155521 RepID=UPI00343DB218